MRTMRIDKGQHLATPWRVHKLAGDFHLLDVWQYPIEVDRRLGEDTYSYRDLVESPEEGITDFNVFARALVWLREGLSRLFDLDDHLNTLPIPGCKETSLRDRLTPEQRAEQVWSTPDAIERKPKVALLPWRTVYEYDDESLLEVSNDTVHALMHVGWIPRDGSILVPRLAIYAKPRGIRGRFYMALIQPFRRWIVYPAIMRHVRRRWEMSRNARFRCSPGD
jgi:hypothetical protein